MTENINDIPRSVLEACRNRGWTDDAIKGMTPRQMFGEYCEWHGLINWGNQLWCVVDALNHMRQAKSK